MIILNTLSNKWDDETLIKYLTTALVTFEPMELYKLDAINSYEEYQRYALTYDFTMITNKER